MSNHPENVKYALVKRRPSAWIQGAKPAAIIAAIQAFFSIADRDFITFVLGVVVVFVAYWVFFTFVVWFWRALRDRFGKNPS
jgi:hypothetical protein